MTPAELEDRNFQALMSGASKPEQFQSASPSGGEGGQDGEQGAGGPPAGGDNGGAPAGGENGGAPEGGDNGGQGGGNPTASELNWEQETGGLYKTQDEFKADFANFRQRRETLNSVFSQLENPIHPSLAQVNNVMRTFEIEDFSTAQKLAATTDEQLQADPILALAVKKVYANPALLKDNSFETIMEAVKEEYGYDGQDNEDKPIFKFANRLSVDKSEALLSIKAKRDELATKNVDIFAKAESNRQQFKAKVEQATAAWQEPTVAPKLTSFLDNIRKVEGQQELNYNPSPELIAKAKEYAQQQLIQSGMLPDEEGLQIFNKYASSFLAINDLPGIVQAAVKMKEAEAIEFSTRFFHNGKPIARQSGPAGGASANNEDEYYRAILNYNAQPKS